MVSKKIYKLLRKLKNRNGKIVELFTGRVAKEGVFNYETTSKGNRLYLNELEIPLSSIREIYHNINPEMWGGSVVYIDPNYQLNLRIAS